MEVIQISASDTRALRFRVLWPHKANVEACIIDIDEAPHAIHLGSMVNGELVGTASLFEMSHREVPGRRQYRLRAMATAPEVRGIGAGKAIVQEAIRRLKADGYDTLWCDARAVALGFYENLGFEYGSDWYEIPQIGPHRRMFYRLSDQDEAEAE